ncbi:MAG: GNAT family N-acetyltransferase [Fusicatenibacter sp.]|nr:GNAT family N-acetyltransferase [Lachnospiraceae bacterium]MDY2937908.1 GNAT family N-acetyltransferase [Fusicatenibacter sp.]
MTEYRKAEPKEWEDCIELANYVFSTNHRPHDFEEILPKVYQAGEQMTAIHRVAVDERGKLRAMVAVLPQELGVCGHKLQAGYVGTVCVHPKARGEGHMKRLLGDWQKELKGKCDLLVLDGQRQRYGYFGFTPGSMRLVFEVSKTNIRHALGNTIEEEITFEPLFSEENKEQGTALAVQLNEAKPFHVVRTKENVEDVMKTFGEEAFGVRKNGELIGYILLAGPGNLVESAFTVPIDQRMVIASYLKWRDVQELEISVPVYEKETIRALSSLAEDCHLSRCGSAMFQILDYAKVLEAYLTLKAQTMGIAPGTFSAVMDGQPILAQSDGVHVTVKKEALPDAVVLSGSQAQELLLSYTAALGDHAGIHKEVWNRIPKDWFPLPLFWYMADEF